MDPKARPDALRRALTLSALGMAGGGTAFALAGCGGDDDHHHDGGSEPLSTLRFANATDVNQLSFLINGFTVYTGLAFGGEVSTYGHVQAGASIIAARSPDGPPDLASTATTLSADRFNSVVAHGFARSNMKLTVFEETNTQPASGSTRVRMFQAAATITERLDVFFTALTDQVLPVTPSFVLANYQDLSLFQTLDSAASYRIRITQPATGTLLFDTLSASGVSFASGSVVTLVIVPARVRTTINLSALPEQAEGGQVGRIA